MPTPPRRKNNRRLPRQQMPRAEALAYFVDLKKIFDLLRDLTASAFARDLRGILAEAPRRDAERADTVTERLSRTLGGVKITFAERVPKARLEEAARKAGRRVAKTQRDQLNKQVKVAAGIDPFITDLRLEDHMRSFVAENVSLVTSIAEKSLGEVEQVVLRGARSGQGVEKISELIQDRFSVAESRANLIARDQTAKLFGEVNELRQRELGITGYTWRSSQDERVRARHESLDGKLQKWSKPPIVDPKTGRREHPGGDYQCRCVAEPILPDDS